MMNETEVTYDITTNDRQFNSGSLLQSSLSDYYLQKKLEARRVLLS